MPLPVLQGGAEVSVESLIRLFHRAALDWSRHLGEETPLAAGVAICNPELSRVSQANRMFDASVPEGMTVPEAIAEVEGHYQSQGSRCGGWVLNPSTPTESSAVLARGLESAGYQRIATDILLLTQVRLAEPQAIAGLTIIPARASFKHYRALAEEDAAEWKRPELADAALLHLDDPRYDALLAIEDGKAVATVGVLSMGEAGIVEDVLVSPAHRRRGIGRLMLHRALEICARSSFKHVLLDVDPTNEPAQRLYRDAGFESIGAFHRYLRKDEDQA